ncbi:MAG: HD domain-containing protein [Actinomycetota bacterium]|nr:HD domain-containing protein [Actinomycetota bacterium]
MTSLPVPTFLLDLPLAREALRCAARLHHGQRREVDAAPFVLHPLEVASLLHNTGHPDPVIAAGVLHDTIEDTDARISDIERRFGGEVAAIVAAMTEDPRIEPFEERKAALRRQIADFGRDASAVYAADKVAKVRELRAQAARDPGVLHAVKEDTHSKLDHYVESLAMLEQIAPQHPLVRQLRFELEVLRALPPHAGLAGDAAVVGR